VKLVDEWVEKKGSLLVDELVDWMVKVKVVMMAF
jgi:hypothetical protein